MTNILLTPLIAFVIYVLLGAGFLQACRQVRGEKPCRNF